MIAKRITAEKVSIAEICSGKFVKKSGFESSYILTSLGRKLSRVRVLGLVVDKYTKEDSNYASITIDDGTQTVRCKVFVNTKIFDGIVAGDLVDVFAKIKEYNGEVYIMPEIVKKVGANYETLRLLELEEIYKTQNQLISKIKESGIKDINELKVILKDQADESEILGILESGCLDGDVQETKKVKADSAKDTILKIIEENNGIDYLSIIEKSGMDENKIDQIVQELLESGVCGEPSPGVIKKL